MSLEQLTLTSISCPLLLINIFYKQAHSVRHSHSTGSALHSLKAVNYRNTCHKNFVVEIYGNGLLLGLVIGRPLGSANAIERSFIAGECFHWYSGVEIEVSS